MNTECLFIGWKLLSIFGNEWYAGGNDSLKITNINK
jgi:hypothetical protein